jgi:hypothetical protein
MKTIIDPFKIKRLYDKRKKGYYLTIAKTEYKRGWAFNGDKAHYSDIDNAEFIMFDPENDKSLETYIKNKLGEWTIKNVKEWAKYVVIAIDDECEELYSW